MTVDNQQLYCVEATGVRSTFGDAEAAARYYQRYVSFLTAVCPPGKDTRLLDVGCGNGWSSSLLAKCGYNVIGADLNAEAFLPAPGPRLAYRQASMLEMPFAGASFDIVTAYQTLEHIPDPKQGLREMLRVCRPGGYVCVVGPNLLGIASVFQSARHALRTRCWRRTPETPRHPFGDTIPETLAHIPLVPARLLGKALSSKVQFTMRVPDTRPPFHGDNDACYLCNPLDLARFFRASGCHITQNGAQGRTGYLRWLAAGTWVVAQKPVD